MNIKYKIVEIHEDNRVMVVRYFTDIITEQDLDIDPNPTGNGSPMRCKSDIALSIPLPEPTEEELHKILMLNAPIDTLKVFETLKTQPNTSVLSVVTNMKDIEFTKTEEEIIAINSTNQLTDTEIDALVKQL